MRTGTRQRWTAGFTLLEVMAALLLMAAIMGMVLAIARSSLRLSKAIVDNQNEEMMHQAFFDMLTRRFSSLPGNTRIDVKLDKSGGRYLTDMTLQNVPMSFTWGGEDRLAKAVQFSTVQRRSGFLDIVLRYYEDEILDPSGPGLDGASATINEPFAEIVLMRDVAYFEWRMLNPQTMEWQDEWADRSRLPLQLELVMAIGANGEEMRHVFWLPPKQNPELVMRQLGQNNRNPQGNPTDPGNPSGGDIQVNPGGANAPTINLNLPE